MEECKLPAGVAPNSDIGPYTFEEFVDASRQFHGYPAPGLLLGGYMVEHAKRFIPEGVLFDAVSETAWCLPDAIQMLTPCTVGNGWLRVLNLGLYALSLFDKRTGEGVRVSVDTDKLENWPEVAVWLFKSKPKRQQDSMAIRAQIRDAGAALCAVEKIFIKDNMLDRKSKGAIGRCSRCGQAYPIAHGPVCRGCQGELPYKKSITLPSEHELEQVLPKAIPVELAVGRRAMHDMTRVRPGDSKSVIVKRGQTIDVGDLCRLQQMGRFSVYVEEDRPSGDWVHEDEAAKAFAQAMAGPGIGIEDAPREGKVNLGAEYSGMLSIDVERLESFNLFPGVMAASRKAGVLVKAGGRIAGTRAIPLFLSRRDFDLAMGILNAGPLFEVKPIKRKRVGAVITGNEVYNGLIEDKFESVIRNKLTEFGCEMVRAIIAPDDTDKIAQAVKNLVHEGAELIVTTAGLSVDPDDVTRKGLVNAGVTDLLYGIPVLPGAMTLLGRLGDVRLLGVPACALFYKITSLDLLLPKLLVDEEITRSDLAKLSHGGLCLECRHCSFPKCSFGR